MAKKLALQVLGFAGKLEPDPLRPGLYLTWDGTGMVSLPLPSESMSILEAVGSWAIVADAAGDRHVMRLKS